MAVEQGVIADKVRLQAMRDAMQREYGIIFVPAPTVQPPIPDPNRVSSLVGPEFVEVADDLLGVLNRYSTAEGYYDPAANDGEYRSAFRRQMRASFGDPFTDLTKGNPYRTNKLACVTGSIEVLADLCAFNDQEEVAFTLRCAATDLHHANGGYDPVAKSIVRKPYHALGTIEEKTAVVETYKRGAYLAQALFSATPLDAGQLPRRYAMMEV